jgi:hypothetical protein
MYQPEGVVVVQRPVATAPFTLGVIGAALGMISIVFPIVFILACIGLPLSFIAWREHKRLAKWSMALNVIAFGLSIAGYFIVADAFS